jgi:hypothetical protein
MEQLNDQTMEVYFWVSLAAYFDYYLLPTNHLKVNTECRIERGNAPVYNAPFHNCDNLASLLNMG